MSSSFFPFLDVGRSNLSITANERFEIYSIKQALGQAAADLIENNSYVGLGSGTTAAEFIKCLATRCEKGLKIRAVASSEASYKLAKSLGINVIKLEEASNLKTNFYVDGADEVSQTTLSMIKGRGGALLREKKLAKNSDKIIILIDDSKYVPNLGLVPLPVEVKKDDWEKTKKDLRKIGYDSDIRLDDRNELYVTDNDNYILDIKLSKYLLDPKAVDEALKKIPNVVETGIFVGLADILLLGHKNGSIETIKAIPYDQEEGMQFPFSLI